jgi:serine/threonine protein kinase
MGAVYRAIDARFQRPCAVKEMLDEFQNETERAQAVEWFEREANLLLDLTHQCIPRVRDFFMEQGRHYLVMDFIEGRTLGEVLEREGNVAGLNGARGMPEERVRHWARQICSVLAYLHNQVPPIIFRDLKPSNIMVTERDDIKLIDFGIARTFQTQRQSTIIMTLGYAPPEQLHGMPEPRSDLYALGATLHRVLTRHDAANNKPSIFSFPPVRVLRPDISAAFEQVIMKAVAPPLEQRWASAAEMERALMLLPPITVIPPVVSAGQMPRPTPAQTQSIGPGSGPKPPSGTVLPSQPSQPAKMGTTGPSGPHIIAAEEHLAAGRIEAAYAATNQAHALEPNNALVHKLYGQVYVRRQPPQPDIALSAFNRSLQLNGEDAETHKLLGDVFLFFRRQPAQAIPMYIQSLRLNARDAEAHQRLAQCYEATNQPEAALREYQEATQLAPQHPGIHFALGQLALRLNRLPLAEQAFVQVLNVNPADHRTRFLLAQVYERENRLADALRECNYVVGPLGVSDPAVPQMLNRLRARLGR